MPDEPDEQVDGTDYPSMGNPDLDSLSGIQIDTNTTEFTLKKSGKPVGTIRRTVSRRRIRGPQTALGSQGRPRHDALFGTGKSGR